MSNYKDAGPVRGYRRAPIKQAARRAVFGATLLLISGSTGAALDARASSASSTAADVDPRAAHFAARGQVIRLAAGAFDPLRDSPPQPLSRVDESKLDERLPVYWLVQSTPGRVADVVGAVDQAGAKLAGYVPEWTFVVRASPRQRAAIDASPAVRWSGLYQPAWRIAPGLTTLEGARVYEVSLFRDEPRLRRARGIIHGLPGVSVEPESSEQVLRVEATYAELDDIASVVAVEWITLQPVYELHNSNARWVVDSGVRDTYAATAPGRLNGSGQTIGVADLAINYLPGPNGRVLEYFSDCSGGTCNPAEYVQAQPGETEDQLNATESTGSSHRKLAAYFDLGNSNVHGTDPSMHGAHVAGTATGDAGGNGWKGADGIAPGARLVHQNIEDPTGSPSGAPEDSYDLWRQAYRPRAPATVPEEWDPDQYADYLPGEDARTHNNSYGGLVPQVNPLDPNAPFALDKFVWDHEDMVIVTSAGNSGDTGLATIDSPSTAKNDLSSAASVNGRVPMNSIDSLAFFSARGPTADGRLGPTVSTPGSSVISAKGGSADEEHAMGGTSMSAPVLTGLATLVREYFYEGWGPGDGKGFGTGQPSSQQHNASAALVKAVIVNGAERMRGWHTGDDGSDRAQDGKWPSYGQGFGRANLDNSLFFEEDDLSNWYHDVWRADDEAFSFPSGPQMREYELQVGAGQPLDVTLAWTDAPNALAAGAPSLVNNLDLVVTGPGGEVYAGNNFNTETDPGADEEFTNPGPAAPDIDNVEERVRVAHPDPGTYQISVSAPELFDGPQGFALATSGVLQEGPALGPGLLSNETGDPSISHVRIEPVAGDTARITWRTNEPTTGRAVLSKDGMQLSFADVYNLGAEGYAGIDEGPVKTSEEYANKLMPGERHEVLATGLTPGSDYEVSIEATDGGGAKVVASAPSLQTGNAIYGAAPADIGSLKEEQAGGWKDASQLYVGRFKDSLPSETDFGSMLGAFMFRIPTSIEPEQVVGAAIQLRTVRDETNPYTDASKYVVDLLDESVEPEWGTQDYEQIRSAPALARLGPTVAERRGGGSEYSYYLSCGQIESLRSTLRDEGAERMAAFRAMALNPPDISAFSYDFGFNEISPGADHRPQLVLFLEDGNRQIDPLPCDVNTPAPKISDLLVSVSEEEPGTAMTVNWTTDVASDSQVLFREKNGGDWHQVSSPVRTTHHMVEVDNLDPFKRYVFAIRSRACNGKQTTDDNGGAGYALREPLPAAALAPTFTFESGEQGWTTEGNEQIPADGWERRSPGDGSAWAWHLAPYQDETDERLISPNLAHPGGIVSLRWRDQREASSSESLHIEWSVDDGEWNLAETFVGMAEDNTRFIGRNVVFSAPAGALRVRFRWESHADISPLFAGVILDNVRLLTSADAPDPPVTTVEGNPPSSADATGLVVPPRRAVPSEADLHHGTAECLPTVHPDAPRWPGIKLRGPSRRPERGKRFPIRVHLRACSQGSSPLAGTEIQLRRRRAGLWKTVRVTQLDDTCSARFKLRARFKRARFKAVWPKQHPSYRRGSSRPVKVVTRAGRG